MERQIRDKDSREGSPRKNPEKCNPKRKLITVEGISRAGKDPERSPRKRRKIARMEIVKKRNSRTNEGRKSNEISRRRFPRREAQGKPRKR